MAKRQARAMVIGRVRDNLRRPPPTWNGRRGCVRSLATTTRMMDAAAGSPTRGFRGIPARSRTSQGVTNTCLRQHVASHSASAEARGQGLRTAFALRAVWGCNQGNDFGVYGVNARGPTQNNTGRTAMVGQL